MGVQDLYRIAKQLVPSSIKPIPSLSSFPPRTRFAIDANLLTTKFNYTSPSISTRATTRHIVRSWYYFLLALERRGIQPVVVFDGETRIVEKQVENLRRREVRDRERERGEAEDRRGERLRAIRDRWDEIGPAEREEFKRQFREAIWGRRRRIDAGLVEEHRPDSTSSTAPATGVVDPDDGRRSLDADPMFSDLHVSLTSLIELYTHFLEDQTNPIYTKNQRKLSTAESKFFEQMGARPPVAETDQVKEDERETRSTGEESPLDLSAQEEPERPRFEDETGQPFFDGQHGGAPPVEPTTTSMNPQSTSSAAGELEAEPRASKIGRLEPAPTSDEPEQQPPTHGARADPEPDGPAAEKEAVELKEVIATSDRLKLSHTKRSRPVPARAFAYVRELVSALGHQVITPRTDEPYEAEAICSRLYQLGHVDYVVSEDTDVLVYGAKLLRKVTTLEPKEPDPDQETASTATPTDSGNPVSVTSDVETGEASVDTASALPLGPMTALKLIREHSTIERVLEDDVVRRKHRLPKAANPRPVVDSTTDGGPSDAPGSDAPKSTEASSTTDPTVSAELDAQKAVDEARLAREWDKEEYLGRIRQARRVFTTPPPIPEHFSTSTASTQEQSGKETGLETDEPDGAYATRPETISSGPVSFDNARRLRPSPELRRLLWMWGIYEGEPTPWRRSRATVAGEGDYFDEGIVEL
ncbi:hypothetical protein JCM10212_006358 [Sporobolomyces blumeae]